MKKMKLLLILLIFIGSCTKVIIIPCENNDPDPIVRKDVIKADSVRTRN